MVIKRPVHNDEGRLDVIDLYEIKNEHLSALGLDLAQVDLLDPDILIKLYDLTFSIVGPDEYYSIRSQQLWKSPNEVPADVVKKDLVWHIRWAIACRLPEVLAWQRSQGKDIDTYVGWLNHQLVQTYPQPQLEKSSGNMPGNKPNFWEKILEKLLNVLFGKLLFTVLPPLTLDDEVLSEFLFSMCYYEVFDESTWEYLLKMPGYLDNEVYINLILLLASVYKKLQPPGLKKYLEQIASEKDDGDKRHDGLVHTAPLILQGKRLKQVSPPYSIGIAVDE